MLSLSGILFMKVRSREICSMFVNKGSSIRDSILTFRIYEVESDEFCQ